MHTIVGFLLLASPALAFPWVASLPGVDSSLLKVRALPGSAADCPFNSNHTGAAPFNPKYPYCGAQAGLPGVFPCNKNLVPAEGDTAHYYTPPGKDDIRGPCPGLNTAANHNFLSHDGITTFAELVDAQQNVYGVGYDLAVLLATLGVGLDGDIVTEKLSLGCDASSRTSANAASSGEVGLDGHNRFEGDTSLTRNDYFLAGGNNFKFNHTLFKMMSKTAAGNFGREQIALYRYQRYQQSLNENGNFYFGPKSLLLFGAASFLYELFPSFPDGVTGVPDQKTEESFFIPERIPDNWYSRANPYSILLVAEEIAAQYELHPVAFGGNTGKPNTFVGIGQYGPYFSSSTFNGTAAGVACLLYQIATDNVPASLAAYSNVPVANFQWAASKLNPIFSALTLGCPLAYNSA